MLIDTHVHLTMPDFGDLDDVLVRAKAVGVERFVVPGLDSVTSKQAIALRQRYPSIIPAVGLHPLSPDEDLAAFETLAAEPMVKAIGEIGTDAKAGEWSKQEDRLRFFLELAIKHHKPALIHIRGTWEPTLAILSDYPGLKGQTVVHCFSAGAKEAEQIAKLGLLLSVTALLARANKQATQGVIKAWPLDQLMLETDGPWLSWQGDAWPNEPSTVAKIAQFVADLKGMSPDEVAAQTTQTAKTFFGLD